ncbi:hypothetical protein Hanom_Chr05g00446871 [Helianthus anomalus]
MLVFEHFMNNFDYKMLCDNLNGHTLNIATMISCQELWANIMPRTIPLRVGM